MANAWDADATTVAITLPALLSQEPVVVRDDGHGMPHSQLDEQFFNIGYDRQQERGPTSPRGRTIRGNKGIGKFAGLQIAETMEVSTVWNGRESRFVLSRHVAG